jgi:hypothetical protein
MIHTLKKSHGKLKPQMVKAPKYEIISRKRRELGNSEKGRIVAFFVIYSDEYSVEKGPVGQHI